MTQRSLAQIVKVINIEAIDGADKIELASVLGWKVAVKKDDKFSIGDLAIYFSIDSVLDTNPRTEFLGGKRLKTKKILGVYSQGLLAPLSWLADYVDMTTFECKEDMDVTELLKVKKWIFDGEEKDEEPSDTKKKIPWLIPKTRENRIQEVAKVIREMPGKEVIITQKYDGCSSTYYFYKGEFGFAGRTALLHRTSLETTETIEKGSEHYFKIAAKYDFERRMTSLGYNIAIQGEIVGPKVNNNRMKLKDHDFFVFNIWDITEQYYYPWAKVEEIASLLGLKLVPVIHRGVFPKSWASVDSLLKVASEQFYAPAGPIAEGIVVKTDYGKDYPRSSFKVISNVYLTMYNL
jgi:RNA ligase (TIGR02306 family)